MSASQTSGRTSLAREAFDPSTVRGKLAIVSAFLVVTTPTLATFVSSFFVILLAAALILSLAGVARAGGGGASGPSTPLARAGYAMAVNGGLLIVALFLTGFIADFLVTSSDAVTTPVALGFTTVHIFLAVGLILVDDHRHAVRSDI